MGNNVDTVNFFPIKKSDAKKNLNITTNKKILVYGSQNPQDIRKGWDILLDSLRKINKEKYFLIIFGNFWSGHKLNEIGLEFKSFGYIDNQNKLRDIYSSGDLYLAPTIEDAWPKSFGESMLCGTPVLGFEKSSIGEVITNDVNGFTVKNINSNDFINAIDKITNDTKKLKIISENGRKLILDNFSPTIIARKYISLYDKILSVNN